MHFAANVTAQLLMPSSDQLEIIRAGLVLVAGLFADRLLIVPSGWLDWRRIDPELPAQEKTVPGLAVLPM